MLKYIILVFIFSLLFFVNTNTANAVEDPLIVTNNKFGIHIVDTNDIESAASLVNTSGGDWGYVTLIITEEERDQKRWQEVFNKMRRLHLIPIVRIATKQEENGWKKFTPEESESWTSFLNSLNWVVKNRYVIIGNEPNHSKEWGGEVNPKEYANVLKGFSISLKNASSDFFILPAGLDASAPDDNSHQSEVSFLKEMISSQPDIFDHIDAWTSHSYPNPNFSGSENDTGKGTIKTYEWEIEKLKELGVEKEFPIFITETGWTHDEYGNVNNEDSLGQKYTKAFNEIWDNEKMVAVTPFILNYIDEPFSVFSWKNKNGEFYPFVDDVKIINKITGTPTQVTSGEVKYLLTPRIVKTNTRFTGVLFLKNTGQSIWEQGEISIEYSSDLPVSFSLPHDVEPNRFVYIPLEFNSGDEEKLVEGKVRVLRRGIPFGEYTYYKISVVKGIFTPWDALIQAKKILLGWMIAKQRDEIASLSLSRIFEIN